METNPVMQKPPYIQEDFLPFPTPMEKERSVSKIWKEQQVYNTVLAGRITLRMTEQEMQWLEDVESLLAAAMRI